MPDQRPSQPLGQPRQRPDCIFCQIVNGSAPSRQEYLIDDEGQLISGSNLIAFHNRLDWARVMLLIVPRNHITQAEFWTTDLLREAARFATAIGDKQCPEGYRLISNFGRPAHQSQEHAHMHLVSGADTDLPATFGQDAGDPQAKPLLDRPLVRITPASVPGVPLAVRITAAGAATQSQLWRGDNFLECGQAAIEYASENTPEGFRLISNFQSPASEYKGGGDAALLLLGGGQLDLYA